MLMKGPYMCLYLAQVAHAVLSVQIILRLHYSLLIVSSSHFQMRYISQLDDGKHPNLQIDFRFQQILYLLGIAGGTLPLLKRTCKKIAGHMK